MKKLLFSTMAVLAFSVSGMANTIELEENILLNELKCESIQNEPTPCQLYAYNIMDRLLDAADDIKMSEKEIIWWGNVALAWCEGYNNSQIQW